MQGQKEERRLFRALLSRVDREWLRRSRVVGATRCTLCDHTTCAARRCRDCVPTTAQRHRGRPDAQRDPRPFHQCSRVRRRLSTPGTGHVRHNTRVRQVADARICPQSGRAAKVDAMETAPTRLGKTGWLGNTRPNRSWSMPASARASYALFVFLKFGPDIGAAPVEVGKAIDACQLDA